jgi:hypothetical protein
VARPNQLKLFASFQERQGGNAESKPKSSKLYKPPCQGRSALFSSLRSSGYFCFHSSSYWSPIKPNLIVSQNCVSIHAAAAVAAAAAALSYCRCCCCCWLEMVICPNATCQNELCGSHVGWTLFIPPFLYPIHTRHNLDIPQLFPLPPPVPTGAGQKPYTTRNSRQLSRHTHHTSIYMHTCPYPHHIYETTPPALARR